VLLEEFTKCLYAHYWPTQIFNLFGELIKLHQEVSVHEYQTKSETLLAKVGNAPHDKQLVAL
jgi:hypothetical protein